jgi:hypothetical protein
MPIIMSDFQLWFASDASRLPCTSSELTVSKCPQLPAELWGSIFSHLDKYTIWMVCRNVSKLLRGEAEGEFARVRLPKLYFKWSFSLGNVLYQGEEYESYFGSIKIIQLASYSKDEERAFFDVRAKFTLQDDDYWQNAEGKQPRMVMPWTSELEDNIQQQLTYSDIYGPYMNSPSFVYIGADINEIEVPGINIDWEKHQVSFLWKQFLTKFYLEESYVRSGRKALGLDHNESPTMADVRELKSLRSKDPSDTSNVKSFLKGDLSLVGTQNAKLYADALEIRLRKAHERANKPFRSLEYAKHYLKRLRCARRQQLIISLVQKQGFWLGKKRYKEW